MVKIVTIPRQMRKTRTEEYLNRKKYDSYHVVEKRFVPEVCQKAKEAYILCSNIRPKHNI